MVEIESLLLEYRNGKVKTQAYFDGLVDQLEVLNGLVDLSDLEKRLSQLEHYNVILEKLLVFPQSYSVRYYAISIFWSYYTKTQKCHGAIYNSMGFTMILLTFQKILSNSRG